MALSPRTKVALTQIAAVVVTLATMVAFGVHRAWHKYAVEDSIHGTFFPVVRALDEFGRDHGGPAASLDQLVPKYIVKIPTSALVDSVQYSSLTDGKTWQLRLHSTALKPPRAYFCRSADEYTSEEEKRVILRYHATWVVLKD